jgi:hypothetical protein
LIYYFEIGGCFSKLNLIHLNQSWHEVITVGKHGGKREGAGRPASGRSKLLFYATKREAGKMRVMLENLRELKESMRGELTFDPVRCSECGEEFIVNSQIERCPVCGALGDMEYIIVDGPGETEGSFLPLEKAKAKFPHLRVFDGSGDFIREIMD